MEEVDILVICDIVRKAGAAILVIYEGDHALEFKDDSSPLTAADRAAHQVIVAELGKRFPHIPVLSEEGKGVPYGVHRHWRRFFLVDPLDGTKEFIKRNGEFTVNVALVEDGRPKLGVVGVPAMDKVYWGMIGVGGWVAEGDAPPRVIAVRTADPNCGLTVVQSRSHPSPELAVYLSGLNVASAVAVGSALKFCLVAEGQADLYPRLGPTMEWDTAAGQALVEAAGGTVRTLSGEQLTYNKEYLMNPNFIVQGRLTS